MAAVIEKARGRARAVDCRIAQRALAVQGLSCDRNDNRFAQFPNQHCVFAFIFSLSWFLHLVLTLSISPVSIFPPFSVHPWLFSHSHIYPSVFFFLLTLLSLSPNSHASHCSVLFNTIFFPIFTLYLSPSRPCRRYEIYPVCADLQGQILACYKENAGKTLNCSNIAALYLQCVNNAKQVRIYWTKVLCCLSLLTSHFSKMQPLFFYNSVLLWSSRKKKKLVGLGDFTQPPIRMRVKRKRVNFHFWVDCSFKNTLHNNAFFPLLKRTTSLCVHLHGQMMCKL